MTWLNAWLHPRRMLLVRCMHVPVYKDDQLLLVNHLVLRLMPTATAAAAALLLLLFTGCLTDS